MHEISRAEMPFRETITNTRTENKKEAVLGFEPFTSTYSDKHNLSIDQRVETPNSS
jgi:hypothetical protein